MKDLATGEFHYSEAKTDTIEGDTYVTKNTKKLPASILRSDFSDVTCIEGSNIFYVAVGDKLGCIQLLRNSNIDRELKTSAYETSVDSLHFSHDDKMLIAVIGGQIYIWNLESASSSPASKISVIGSITVAKFTTDGLGIVAGCSNGDVLILDTSGNLLFTNSDDSKVINDLALTSDGEYVISVSNSGTTRVIKLADGTEHYVHSTNLHQGSINSIDIISRTIGPNTNDIIVTGGDDEQFRIAVWDECNDGGFLIAETSLYSISSMTSNKISSVIFDPFNGDALVTNGYHIDRWELDEDTGIYNFKQTSSEPGIFPKKITRLGVRIYSCNGRSPAIAEWSMLFAGDFIREVKLYSEIVQVVVWPNPDFFNVSEPNWPMGPIAVGSPITCYAKRVADISDMVWGDSLREILIYNIKIHGYYTEGFSRGILDDPSEEYLG